MSDADRFWEKVDVTLSCWEWKAATFTNGYGMFTIKGWPIKAHRYAYELLVGPIPDGLQIDHLCFNKRCVNPAHLEAVTAKVNCRRYTDRITHCPRGHALEGDNLYVHNGKRSCRTCRAETSRRWKLAKRGVSA